MDPWSEEVTNDINLQARITIEISNNLWYFLREVVKVPTPGGSVHYEIHRGNLAMNFMMLANVNTAIELPRQHYKTYSAVCFYLWVMLYKAKNYSMIFTHKSYGDAVENLRKLKVLIDPENGCLPEYLIPTPDNNGDKNNENQLILGNNNNSIKVISPSTSESGADKAGIEWKLIIMAFARYKLF